MAVHDPEDLAELVADGERMRIVDPGDVHPRIAVQLRQSDDVPLPGSEKGNERHRIALVSPLVHVGRASRSRVGPRRPNHAETAIAGPMRPVARRILPARRP